MARAQTAPSAARGIVRGVVSDSAGNGIANAQVSIVGTDIRTLTGVDGGYLLLAVWPGNAIVAVRRLGFSPESLSVRVPPADSVLANFKLKFMAVRLAGEEISADPLH